MMSYAVVSGVLSRHNDMRTYACVQMKQADYEAEEPEVLNPREIQRREQPVGVIPGAAHNHIFQRDNARTRNLALTGSLRVSAAIMAGC